MKNKIKIERAKIEITQRKLVEKIGIGLNQLVNIEKNRGKISLLTAYKLAKFFDVSIYYLFTFENSDL